MTAFFFRYRRFVLAALLVLLAAVGARAQAPEFSYWERTPLPQQGLATYYDPGVMEQVLDYRLASQDIDRCVECVGTVALLRAGDIGRKVWLQPPGGDPVGPFLVVDCARRQDVQPLLDRNWVVDVSYEVGQYWGMNRPLDGVIVFEDPADLVPGRAVNRIPTPFVVAPGEVVISPPTATPWAPAIDLPPTAWPTRVPVPLIPLSSFRAAEEDQPTPTALALTPTPIWPSPLTPIVTTPTPVATSGAPGSEAIPPARPATPTPTPTEVALGRAGGELLAVLYGMETQVDTLQTAIAPADQQLSTSIIPTARPTLVRTPRPNLTPLLSVGPPAMPTSTPDPSLLDRILHGLIDLVR